MGGVVEFSGWFSAERVVKPDSVVLLDVGEAAKRVREGAMVAVEVTQVGAVNRLTREKTGRDGADLTSGVG